MNGNSASDNGNIDVENKRFEANSNEEMAALSDLMKLVLTIFRIVRTSISLRIVPLLVLILLFCSNWLVSRDRTAVNQLDARHYREKSVQNTRNIPSEQVHSYLEETVGSQQYSCQID